MAEQLYSSLLAKATLFEIDGERESALLCLQDAALAIEKEFCPNDKRRAVAIEQQVDLFRALGRHRQADAALQEATRIRLKRLRGAGRSLEQQQKYAEAEKLFRNALNICEQAYGPDHRETATCLDNLATCLRKQSRFVDAVTYCSAAKGIRERVLGDSHSHTATSYCNLGFLYRSLGRYDEAQTLLAKSLKSREKRLGPDHPLVAESLDRLAALCRDLGRFEEAAQLCERGLRIREEALGPGHPLTAASLNNLALSREGRITTSGKKPSTETDRNDAYVSYSLSEETESPAGDKANEIVTTTIKKLLSDKTTSLAICLSEA